MKLGWYSPHLSVLMLCCKPVKVAHYWSHKLFLSLFFFSKNHIFCACGIWEHGGRHQSSSKRPKICNTCSYFGWLTSTVSFNLFIFFATLNLQYWYLWVCMWVMLACIYQFGFMDGFSDMCIELLELLLEKLLLLLLKIRFRTWWVLVLDDWLLETLQ